MSNRDDIRVGLAVAAAVPYVLLVRAILDALDSPLGWVPFVLAGALYGMLVGRWWAVLAAALLLLLLVEVRASDLGDDEDPFALILGLLLVVFIPVAAISIAAGVALRRLLERSRRASS
jgi:hypothetical protein